MADIPGNSPSRPNKGSKPRSRKLSTRVDLTPMVDLAFLLLTFFMLTTILAHPNVMALAMPETHEADPQPLKETQALTLLLGPHDKVYWYEGLFQNKVDSADYSAEGLRKVILDKMEKVKNQWGLEPFVDSKSHTAKQGSYLYTIVKPDARSRYKNLVDALDEMSVCKVRYYTVLDISKEEAGMMK